MPQTPWWTGRAWGPDEGSKTGQKRLPSTSTSLKAAKASKSTGERVHFTVEPPWFTPAGERMGDGVDMGGVMGMGDSMDMRGFVHIWSWSPNCNQSINSRFCPPRRRRFSCAC